MVYKAEYIWIDGTEPTAKLRSKTKIVPDGAELPIWGFDGSSTNQATGDKSDCVLMPVFHCPDPIRGGNDVLVMCEVYARRRQAAPDEHPRRARQDGQEVRQARVLVRHRAGVHVLQGRPPVRLPGRRLPGPAGRLLLRRRLRRDLRPRDRRGAPRQLPRRRPVVQRPQRRGDDRPVGVPDRPARPARGRRPAVDRPLAALPHGRGLRRGRHARPQADEGRLERRRRAHQLLHQGDARGRRLPVHRERLQGARQEWSSCTSRTTATASRTASPVTTRRPVRTSSATACPTAARRSASRCRCYKDGKGYLEDRRPNANMDPYVVARLMVDTVCSAI